MDAVCQPRWDRELCLPGEGVEGCSRSGGHQEKQQSLLRLVELLQKKMAPADQDVMK